MDEDFIWPEDEIIHLHQQVIGELQSLFNHDATVSNTLLREWLAKFPQWTPDVISHKGPFDTAQRIHYHIVLGRDHNSVEYLDWRKQFHAVWKARQEPELTEMQKSILRSRGLNV